VVLGIIFSDLPKKSLFMPDKKKNNKKTVSAPVKSTAERHPEFETPSQRRNRDGVGRGPNGSDGGSVKGRGSNH
jgi:hypothetical protein